MLSQTSTYITLFYKKYLFILDESHPMPNAVESILAVFLMSLGRDLTAKYHYPLDCSLSTFIDIPYKNYYVPGVHILDTL